MRNKLIAAGAGLVGYGALVGWAITADLYEKKLNNSQLLWREMMRRQSTQIEEQRITPTPPAAEEIRTSETSLDSNAIEDVEPILEDTDEAESDESSEVDEIKTEEIRENLQNLINGYTNDEDAVQDFSQMATAFEEDDTPPFVIPRKLYQWDEDEGDEYSKIALTYYPRERILLDDEDDLVDDVANTIGWRNLTRFGDESDDADVVFVRNRRLQTDFEVVRDTENQPPAHIRFGMDREEYESKKAAGLIRFRPGVT